MVLAGLVLLLLIVIGALYGIGRSSLNKYYDITPETLTISNDPAVIARGEHIVTAISECVGCHGDNLQGQAFFNDPAIGTVSSVNLTSGQGGIGASYTDLDWVRSIRHGVRPNGKPLLIMPAQYFHNMSAEDLSAVIAYVKSRQPVDNTPPATNLKPLTYVLMALGQLGELPANQIDQNAPFPVAPEAGPTAEYGKYLISISPCGDCHGANLAGGTAGPGGPVAPNLTPAGELSGWTQEDFLTLFETGKTPNGHQLSEDMPWQVYGRMTDDELIAIWLYFQSLEPIETPAKLAGS